MNYYALFTPFWGVLIRGNTGLPGLIPFTASLIFSLSFEGIGFEWFPALISIFLGFFSLIILVGKQLPNDLVMRILSWTGHFTKRMGYKRYYCRLLLSRHRSFDVSGLPTQPEKGLDLAPIFIQLCLVNKPVQRTSSDPIKPPEAFHEGPQEIWDYLRTTEEHLVVLGAPGSGKTTLLQHMTVELTGRKKRRIRATSYQLPFFLSLRDYQDDTKNTSTLSLVATIEKDLSKWGQTPPLGWVESQLVRKKCLILLDGLDEVADKAARRRMIDWVQRQMVAYYRCRFVITSRPYGYQGNELLSPIILEVQAFTPEQITRFVQNWYQAKERDKEKQPDEHIGGQAQKKAEDLLKRLRRKPALRKLAVNPLLLTMIAMVHSYRATLPENRVELYKEVCEVFFGRREESRGVVLRLKPLQQQWILEHLAYNLMQQREITFAQEQVEELLTDPLTQIDPTLSPKEFLLLIEERSGLFLAKELGVYGFTHKAFQEYLAAVYIGKRGLVQELVTKVNDGWWRETILLYCAQNDATPLIQACLTGDVPTVSLLQLALECRDEAHRFQPEVRLQLDILINQGAEDHLPAKRWAVAETLLKRHLNFDQLIPLSELEDVLVSPSFVNCIEYQLFLD